MRLLVLTSCVLLTSATGALARTASQDADLSGDSTAVTVQAPLAAPKALMDDDKIECRSRRVTGSRFPVRTCHTKKEWRERLETTQRNQQRTLERYEPMMLRRGSDIKPAG